MNFPLIVFLAIIIIELMVCPVVESFGCPAGSFRCDDMCCSNQGYCCKLKYSDYHFCSLQNDENQLGGSNCWEGLAFATDQEDIHKQVISEISMAMEFVQEKERNPIAEKCLKVLNHITPDSKDTRKLFKDWAEMFHKEGNRNANEYFVTFQDAYPNVRAVSELPSGVFSTCFDIFVDATEQYQKYRQMLAGRAAK